MASIKAKLTVGIFVLVGFVLVLVSVLWLGLSATFEEGQLFAAYFDESVQGLNKDSPVKYRGVAVGRVDTIRVAPDANLIEVLLKIDTDINLPEDVVGTLKSVGITGIMFVELERLTTGKGAASPVLTFDAEYPIIPTQPSQIKEIFESIDAAFSAIKGFDFQGVSERLTTTLAAMETTLSDVRIRQLSLEIEQSLANLNNALLAVRDGGAAVEGFSRDAATTVDHLNATLQEIDQFVQSNKSELLSVYDNFKQVIDNANLLMTEGIELVEHSDSRVAEIEEQLVPTLQQLESVVDSMDRFMTIVSVQPGQLLFGEPPTERPTIEK